MTDRIDLDGVVDIHTHAGPSPFDRRGDGYEAGVDAAAAGIDALVVKEHFFPTAYGTSYVGRLLDRDGLDVDVLGSIVLNYCNGGFNPFAVQAAIDYGASVVWGPTIDARHHAEQTGELGNFLGVAAGEAYDAVDGISALDDDGDLRADVRLCIETVVANDVVLALGHLSYDETYAMMEYAAELGHDKLVVDHPTYHVTDLSIEQQESLVSLGAVLNFPFLAISQEYGWNTVPDLAANIRAVGVDNCVVSSDVGQSATPGVPESLRALGGALLDEGFSASEFRQLTAHEPKRLLALD